MVLKGLFKIERKKGRVKIWANFDDENRIDENGIRIHRVETAWNVHYMSIKDIDELKDLHAIIGEFLEAIPDA